MSKELFKRLHAAQVHAGERVVIDDLRRRGLLDKQYDFTRFDRLITHLQEWRNEDHEDNKVLCRNHVIEIIEGVKALRGDHQ